MIGMATRIDVCYEAPMPAPQWPASVFGSQVHEVIHAIAHLWEHVDALHGQTCRRFHQLSQEITKMSQSLTDQFNAAITKVNTDIDALSSEVQTLLAGMVPGEPLTQAMVDAVTGIAARLEAIPAIPQVAPPPPPAAA